MSGISNRCDALIILDGWGINPDEKGNAVRLAETPFLDKLQENFPAAKLSCSGNAVGLPPGIMGNSEVGHMNMGAGRKVLQNLVRIDKAIENGEFGASPVIKSLMERLKKSGRALHLMGLLSDGGVHSHINHLFALLSTARDQGLSKVYVHAVLDGRDTPPTSGAGYVKQLQDHLDKTGLGTIATLCGRYYAMDRDTRWERVESAYDLYTLGQGESAHDPVKALENAYEKDLTDEFITPVILTPEGKVRDGDGIIFFNFRADRAREITRAFTEKSFDAFQRKVSPDLEEFVTMTRYDESFPLEAVFAPQHLTNVLGEVIASHGLPQLRLAETEKYAHVTYFFNGGNERIFPLEERILIPSPRNVATYDLKPEMSAFEVAETACRQIKSGKFRLLVINFANMDMVGHTGIIQAGIKACETVDTCLKQVVEAIFETGGTAMVTADHGNAEEMMAEDGSPHTAHTLNQVRFILAGKAHQNTRLRDEGILGDIAPTVLDIMKLPKPPEMTGLSLINK